MQLPELASNTTFINNKKEELLKRQVNVWNTQMRGKKDRREVRMLGNWHIYFLIRHVLYIRSVFWILFWLSLFLIENLGFLIDSKYMKRRKTYYLRLPLLKSAVKTTGMNYYYLNTKILSEFRILFFNKH